MKKKISLIISITLCTLLLVANSAAVFASSSNSSSSSSSSSSNSSSSNSSSNNDTSDSSSRSSNSSSNSGSSSSSSSSGNSSNSSGSSSSSNSNSSSNTSDSSSSSGSSSSNSSRTSTSNDDDEDEDDETSTSSRDDEDEEDEDEDTTASESSYEVEYNEETALAYNQLEVVYQASASLDDTNYGGNNLDYYAKLNQKYFIYLYTQVDKLTVEDENLAILGSETGTEEYRKALISLRNGWIDIKDEVGELELTEGDELYRLKEAPIIELSKNGHTLTVNGTYKLSKKDVVVSIVMDTLKYDKDGLVISDAEITDMTVNIDYTLGEIMQKAGLNTAMAMGIVFTVLILIALVIYSFNIFAVIGNKSGKKDDEAKPEEKPVVKETPAVSSDEVDDGELIAVIAAAIAASTGQTTDSFVVRSIKRRLQ